MSGKKKGPGGGRPGGTPEDPWQDPGMLRWMKRAETDLVPKLRGSRISASLVPEEGKTDFKFAVELGLSIMMDKPIIAMVQPGQVLPDHMIRVADAIVELDWDDQEGTSRRIKEAIEKLGMDPAEDEGYVMHHQQDPPPIVDPDE